MADLNAYQGNAELGYGTAGNGAGMLGTFTPKISVDAADKLAYYNFQEQRDQWQRRNTLKDAEAAKAEEMLAFTYGDFEPQDRKYIDDAIADYTKAYTADPTAVTIKMGADGKPSNAEAVAALYQKRQNVASVIKRANSRASQFSSLRGQLKEVTGDETKLAEYNTWRDQQLAKPFESNIDLYPNIDVFDFNKYLAGLPAQDVEFDHLTQVGKGNDNIVVKRTISNVQNLISQFNSDYHTKPLLQKSFDSQYQSFQGIMQGAFDPETQKYDITKIRGTQVGQDMLQMQNAANSFITDFNQQEVLDASGAAAVTPVNLEDGLSQQELFTMIAAYKLKQKQDATVTHTGLALGYTTQANEMTKARMQDATARKNAQLAADNKPGSEIAAGEKVFRDLWGISKAAGEGDKGFKPIPISGVVSSAFSRQRDESVKREKFAPTEAGQLQFEEALAKNLQVPAQVTASKVGGRLKVRIYYNDKQGNATSTYEEYDQDDVISNLPKQYAGGTVQRQTDEQVVRYRNQAFGGQVTLDKLDQMFGQGQATPPPAGGTPGGKPQISADDKAKLIKAKQAGAVKAVTDASGKLVGYIDKNGKTVYF